MKWSVEASEEDGRRVEKRGSMNTQLTDWVLEYDAQQERREEIETLKREIAEMRNSMSEVLKLVNGVMDLTTRRISL